MNEPSLKTRREFLANCGVVTAAATLPQFLVRTAHGVAVANGWEPGSETPLPGFKDDRVLVVVQLSGGNDGLNTIIPHADDDYHRVRPQLAIKADQRLRLDDEVSLHAALKPLKSLYDDGRVALIQGVGYPNPNRSHFRSMEIWHTASDADQYLNAGWIGRYFDNNCAGEPQATAGVAIGDEFPQAFGGERGMGVAFQTPERFGYVPGRKGDDLASFRAINRADAPAPNDQVDFLRHVTRNADLTSERLRQTNQRTRNAVRYPFDPFGQGLATVARMIAGGLGARIYYVSLGGFDTHSNQAGQHERLLGVYASGLEAFHRDLTALGQSRRVLVMTFSEFGRRVRQNASGGTDHGTAAPMILTGHAVAGGLKGRRPSLADLDQGDLKHTVDFRSVYASVLRQWFDADPTVVLGRPFPDLPLLSA